MSSLIKKVLKGGGKRTHSPPPVTPPSPDLSHLTADELSILSDVLKRQERFEQQEQERVRRLEAEMQAAEQAVKSSQPERSRKWRIASARLCRLCFKTRMSEGAGRTCSDCRKRVCGRCGSYHRLKTASQKGVWLCRLCLMKREVSCRTGGWYHGARGHDYPQDANLSSTAATALRRKLKDFNAESTGSDHQTSAENKGDSDELSHSALKPVSDSQLLADPARDPGHHSRRAQHSSALRPTSRRRSLPLGAAPPPSHHRHVPDHDDEDESIQDILLERKLSYRRRQQKRLKRRSMQNGQGKTAGGGGGGGWSVKEAVFSNVKERKEELSSSSAETRVLASYPDRFVSIPLHTSPDSVEETEVFPQGVQSAVTSPLTPERPSSFNLTRSQDYTHFRPDSVVFDASCNSFLHKTASTRRRAFQKSSGSGGQKLSITVQKSSFSDAEPRSPVMHHEDCVFRSLHEGRVSPRSDRLTSPDDRRLASSPEDRHGHHRSSRTPSPSVSRRSPVSRDKSPSGVKKILKAGSLSPGNRRRAGQTEHVSPAEPRVVHHAGRASPSGPPCPTPSSEPTTPTGWKDPHFRGSLSPHNTRRAKTTATVSPTHTRKTYEKRRCGDGAGREPPHQVVEAVPKTSKQRVHSLEVDSGTKLKIRSYSEGHDQEDQEARGESSLEASRSRCCASQCSVRVGGDPAPPGKASAQKSPRAKARDSHRAPSAATSITTSITAPSVSNAYAAQPLRRVRSPDADASQSESREAVMCRCLTGDGRLVGRRGASGDTGRKEGRRNSSPRDFLTVYEQDTWDEDAQLVHTVLHKPLSSYPKAFGVHVIGGICDVNDVLTTIIKDVTSGSPAQLAGLQPGDQVLEWNGQPLSGATFERVLDLVSRTRSNTLHLFTLPKRFVGRAASPFRCSSRSSDVELRGTSPPSPGHSASDTALPSSTTHKRRLLPRTPVEIGRESRQMSGELLLSLDYDPSTAVLYVTLISARDLAVPEERSGSEHRGSDSHGAGHDENNCKAILIQGAELGAEGSRGGKGPEPHGREPPQVTVQNAENGCSGIEGAELEYGLTTVPSPFVLVHLLPDRRSREPQKTEPRYHSRKADWEQTFVYDSFTITELEARSLEVTVWSRGEASEVFLGEILLDLRDWRLYQQPSWLHLHDHDDNSPALPRPRQLYTLDSVVSSASSSCYDDLSLARSGGVPAGVNSSGDLGRDGSESGPSGKEALHVNTVSGAAHGDTLGHKLSRVTRGMVKNKLVSRMSSSFSHADRKGETASDESSPGDVTRRRSVSDTHHLQGQGQDELRLTSPVYQRRPSISYNMDLLAPPRPLSRANSSSSFFLSDDSSDGDPYSPSPVTPDRPAPDGDDITSILGPGQVPPRPSSETLVCGDIKVGLAVSKGQLEVDIICVKGLQRQANFQPPDSYVKTYLVEGHKTIQKKKSQVVKASTDPIFRRKIKYSACNVHGRHMRIVVWEKPRNFERKQSLGETVIRLDALDLSAHTMTWYKLFPVNSTDLGSTDSLSQW